MVFDIETGVRRRAIGVWKLQIMSDQLPTFPAAPEGEEGRVRDGRGRRVMECSDGECGVMGER